MSGMLLPENGVQSTGGLCLADKWDRIETGMTLGIGYRWEIGMGASVSSVTPQISLEINWVSLSRLNPTNVASFGSRCLHFSQFSLSCNIPNRQQIFAVEKRSIFPAYQS